MDFFMSVITGHLKSSPVCAEQFDCYVLYVRHLRNLNLQKKEFNILVLAQCISPSRWAWRVYLRNRCCIALGLSDFYFIHKNDKFTFQPSFRGVRGNICTSSIARWKARGRLPIRYKLSPIIKLFSLVLTVQTL